MIEILGIRHRGHRAANRIFVTEQGLVWELYRVPGGLAKSLEISSGSTVALTGDGLL